MKPIGLVAVGLASLSLGACAANIARTPANTTVAVRARGARWQDPDYFATRVHDRVARIEQRVRGEVQAGEVRPEAVSELVSRRNQIEAELAQIGADGVVTLTERDYVRALVHDVDAIPLRYSLNASAGYFGNQYGGGPPSSYVPQTGLGDDAWW